MLDEKVAAVLEQMKPRLEAHKVLLTCWDDWRMVGRGVRVSKRFAEPRKKSDQERYIQSSSRFNVSTLMSHRRSLTKNCCEGSWLKIIFFMPKQKDFSSDWTHQTVDGVKSVVSWWSRLTKSFPGLLSSWGDCSADRKRVLSTVDSCGDFVSVFVSSFPADRVLRYFDAHLKHWSTWISHVGAVRWS